MYPNTQYKMLQLKKITKTNKSVDKKNLITAMHYTHEHCSFSTIPYFKHNTFSSDFTLQSYHSGNCIAMCLFAQKYLKNTFNITSFIIPASIPIKYQRPGYLKICHVALCVPKHTKGYYILDLAFYFIQPIFIYNNNLKKKRYGKNKNIYNNNSIETLEFSSIILPSNKILNEYQFMPKGTIVCTFNYIYDLLDNWNYYIIEVIKPDDSIGRTFLTSNINKFITVTDKLSNLILYIKQKEYNADSINIKYKHTDLYDGLISDIEPNLLHKLNTIFKSFFPKGIIHAFKNT